MQNKPELTTDEAKVYLEFIQLFNSPTMAINIQDSQLDVVASLGVGIYRQGKREQNETREEEIKQAVQMATKLERDSWLNQKTNEHDARIRASERAAVIAEIEGWADENQMSPFANLGSTKYVRYAKLRAKLVEMKEGK